MLRARRRRRAVAPATAPQEVRAVDAYEYVVNILRPCLEATLDERSCKACYDNLAYTRALVDLYSGPSRARLVEIYNATLARVSEACRGYERATRAREEYERSGQIVRLKPAASREMCLAYAENVARWWAGAGYPKDVDRFLAYFSNLKGYHGMDIDASTCLREFGPEIADTVRRAWS
ncbi:MAG: hypothetical protein QW067_11655 [Thermofilaceae archaeon]